MPSVMCRVFTVELHVNDGDITVVEGGGLFVQGTLACIGDECDGKKADPLFDRGSRKPCPQAKSGVTTKPKKTTPKKTTPKKTTTTTKKIATTKKNMKLCKIMRRPFLLAR